MFEKIIGAAISLTVSFMSPCVLAAHDAHPHHRGGIPSQAVHHHHHAAGSWMFSYRYISMSMEGLLKDGNSIAPEQALNELVNLPYGLTKVRVVPREMTSNMHMLGAMYAVNDQLTLMGMLGYLDKQMDLTTYAGMMGDSVLGEFSTTSSGMGDSKVSVLWGLHEDRVHKVHLNLGLSLPTGSIEHTGFALTPMGTRVEIRLPYGMQLGSGSWDLEPGITYGAYAGKWGWGANYRATLRLNDNEAGYRFGNLHQAVAWSSLKPVEWLTGTLRLTYVREGDIEGRDAAIAAPVTTADPSNYGGERLNLGFGVGLIGKSGGLRGHQLEFQYDVPLHQDLNGLQMDMQSMIGLNYQYAF